MNTIQKTTIAFGIAAAAFLSAAGTQACCLPADDFPGVTPAEQKDNAQPVDTEADKTAPAADLSVEEEFPMPPPPLGTPEQLNKYNEYLDSLEKKPGQTTRREFPYPPDPIDPDVRTLRCPGHSTCERLPMPPEPVR